MTIVALATSRHATCDYGPLRCIGHFAGAINFLTPHHRLLTLHRAGRGLSPMGWLLNADDFDEASDRLAATGSANFSPTGIRLAHWRIRPALSPCDLGLHRQGVIGLAGLRAALMAHPAQTGLFGPLDDMVRGHCCAEVIDLRERFSAWRRAERVNWDTVLGKGPGLTPSNDDTLLGMLFIAYLDRRADVARLPAFFAAGQNPHRLTTSVSACYLQFAARGIFALPLHALANALLAGEEPAAAVAALLAVGHFSGADTLLGIWLALTALNDPGKRQLTAPAGQDLPRGRQPD